MTSWIKKSLRLSLLALCVALFISLTGCGKDADQQSLLRYIPADSPYFFANSEPLPPKIQEKYLTYWSGFLGLFADQIQKDLEALQAGEKSAENPLSADALQKPLSVIKQITPKLSREGLISVGIDPNGKAALYGHGILPTYRIEITDPAKMEAFISELEQSFEPAEKSQFEGQTYRRAQTDNLTFIAAVLPKQLVIAFVPTALEKDYLPLLFGKQVPQNNLLESNGYAQLLKAHNYTPYGAGAVDLQRVVKLFTGQAKGESSQMLKSFIPNYQAPPAECANFMNSLVKSAPRYVIGMTELDEQGSTTTAVLETSKKLSTTLKKLSVSMPAIGSNKDAVFAFGMALNLSEMRRAIKLLLQEIGAQSQGCEWINPDDLKQATQEINLAFNPMTAAFKGIYLEVADLELDPQTGMPKTLDIAALLQVDDPRGVFALMGMVNPEVAQMDIPTDGTPVALPANLAPIPLPPSHVAMKDKSLALALGETSAEKATKLLASEVNPRQPIFSYSVGFERLSKLMSAMMPQILANLPEEQKADFQAQNKFWELYAKYAKSISLDMAITEQGMTFFVEETFK